MPDETPGRGLLVHYCELVSGGKRHPLEKLIIRADY